MDKTTFPAGSILFTSLKEHEANCPSKDSDCNIIKKIVFACGYTMEHGLN